jgi:histidyl-tRNA synthetase
VALLGEYLGEHEDELCDEHTKSWRQNPLRVLDCKREECVEVTSKGPMLIDHICDACRAHFDAVVEGLSAIGIATTLAPRLVRGFDYYNRTTFEFVADAFESAQNSIGGGGRYDQLAEELGGKPTSGIGFGSGVERILLAREAEGVTSELLKRSLDLFVIDTTGDVSVAAMIETLRLAGFATDRAYDQRSMKAQMKAADRSGARFALLVGPEELAAGEVTIRDLRSQDFGQTQQRAVRGEIVATVANLFTK